MPTPKNPVDLTPPAAISGEAASTPAIPVTVSTNTPNDPVAPVVVGTEASVAPAVPVALSTNTPLDPSAPVALSTNTPLDPSAPVVVGTQASVDPAIPVAVSTQTALAPATPISVATQPSSNINRTLYPLFRFNSDLGLPDSVTYSRTSDATYLEEYVGPLNRKQKRIALDYVGDVENLITYSQDLDNAAWTQNNVTAVKINDKNSDLTTGAFKIISTVAGTFHSINTPLFSTTIGLSNTTSAIVKKAEYTLYRITYNSSGHGASQYATFDLESGTIVNSVGGIAAIKFLNNGWYDCSFTAVATATVATGQANLGAIISRTDGRDSPYTADGTKGILLYKTQITESAKPLPYVRTFDVAVTETFTANPRYEDKGLLVEGASTNLALNSEDFTTVTGATTTPNQALAPDGSFSADLFVSSTAGGRSRTTVLTSTDTVLTASVFVKKTTANFIIMSIADSGQANIGYRWFDLNNLTIGTTSEVGTGYISTSATIEQVTNDWIRITSTCTVTASQARLVLISQSFSDGVFNAAATDSSFLWGVQCEGYPFATSYIRTEGATASRAAEDITGLIKPIITGNITVEAQSLGVNKTTNNFIFNINNGVTSNFVAIIAKLDTAQIASQIQLAGVSQNDFTGTDVLADGLVKASLNFAQNNIVGYFGDDAPQTDTSASLVEYDEFRIGALGVILPFYGNIKRIEVYDTILTPNEVKKL